MKPVLRGAKVLTGFLKPFYGKKAGKPFYVLITLGNSA